MNIAQHFRWLLLVVALVSGPLVAQKLTVDPYYISIVSKTGERYDGTLHDVTNNAIFYTPGISVPIETVEKVVLRRINKRLSVRAGAVAGGFLLGILAATGLQKSPTSSSVTYGLTLGFSIAGGAVLGAWGGTLLGNLRRLVIRPRAGEHGLDSFRNELEPFSIRYQTNLFNRVHE